MNTFFSLILYGILLIVFSENSFAGTINLKVEATNPSDTDTRTLPVRAYLPKGISAQEVVDKGAFNVAYDFDKSLYYAYQDVTLKPEETIKLQIGIKDIWVIPESEVLGMMDHAKSLTDTLSKTSYVGQAKALGGEINENLQKVMNSQEQSSLSVDERISNFQTNTELIKAVKKTMGVMEDMIIDNSSGESIGALMGEDVLTIDPLKDVTDYNKLQFNLDVSNQGGEARELDLKYPLPSEVKPSVITNKGGLEVEYDYEQGVYYLKKLKIPLQPGESKKYVVEIKDLWIVPEKKSILVKERTEKMMHILEGSTYKDAAKLLRDKILSILENIDQTQKDKSISVENHIGLYRLNLEKFEQALKDLARMQKLVVQAGGTEKAISRTTYALDNGSKTEGLRGARGVEIISKSFFKSKAPDFATTWKIIWIILAFLGILSFLFFILWWVQLKRGEGDKYTDVQNNDPKP